MFIEPAIASDCQASWNDFNRSSENQNFKAIADASSVTNQSEFKANAGNRHQARETARGSKSRGVLFLCLIG